MKELTLKAVVENIDQVIAFLDEELDALDCPMKAHLQINVAVDELFSNIARYAYDTVNGLATVRLETEENPRAVIISFIDSGVPYDPLKREDPDTTLALDERQIGGLGIFLVKKTMDDMKYQYKDGKNILQIKKVF